MLEHLARPPPCKSELFAILSKYENQANQPYTRRGGRASGDAPLGSAWSQTKENCSSIRRSSCQDSFLSCLPRIPITPNCLLCVALAIIFVLLWCLLCQIFKESYHVSSAKLYRLRVFSSLHINLSLPAPQHLPIHAVQCLLWITSWKWRNFSPQNYWHWCALFKAATNTPHWELPRHDPVHYCFKYSTGPFSPPNDISLN